MHILRYFVEGQTMNDQLKEDQYDDHGIISYTETDHDEDEGDEANRSDDQ